MRKATYLRTRAFSWKRCANETLEFLETTYGKFRAAADRIANRVPL